MNKMINEIMEIHSNDVCLFKVGSFYHAYGRDACVMAYLFDYKIKELGDNHKECGFPVGAVNKVTAKLQNSSINYLLIDRRNDYEVDEKEDYNNNNKYEAIYEKAHKYVNCRKRIDNINKIIARMEEIVYES